MSFIVHYVKKSMQKRLERIDEDPRKQYIIIVNTLNWFAKLIGSDILTPTYTPKNIVLSFVLFDVFLFFCVDAYNMWINYGQLEDFIYCFETLLFAVIVMIKYYVFTFAYQEMQSLHQHILDFNKRFSGDTEQTKLIANSTLSTFTLVVLYSISCFFSLGIILLYTLIWSVFVDYVVPFGFLLPGIGIDYVQGFVINYIYQFTQCIFALVGLSASEGFFFTLLMNACLQIDMLCLEVERLCSLTVQNTQGQHTLEIRTTLNRIIQNHVDHIQYISKLSDMFEILFFFIFGSTFFQLTSNVVVVLLVPNWYPGYFMFVMLTSQLLFSCALGEMFDSKCKKLSDAIYNVAWYTLDRRDQKALQLLLLASQNPVLISYGFGVVNIRAFFEIYQKTYSIGMMVLSANEN